MSQPTQGALLIVDDEELFAGALAAALRLEGEVRTLVAGTGAEALRLVREQVVDIILLDQQLPDTDGPRLCPQLLAANPHAKIIFATAHPTVENARAAVRAGAFDYLPKPIGLDEILLAIGRCRAALAGERASSLLRWRRGRESAAATIVGDAPSTRTLRELIARAGEVTSPVLLTGETGTGKSRVARAIHHASTRRDGELVEVNCASIPESLVEAELFGARKGAFTGANIDREGLIELADGGTLFLDEIAEMPLALQPKLLHVLEEHSVRRVGGERARPVDFRLITATNVAVDDAVHDGRLRADLFYRLDVIRIRIPPLRERRQDIPALARHLLRQVAPPEAHLEAAELAALTRHDWPRNVLEQAWFLRRGGEVRPSELLARRPDKGMPPASPMAAASGPSTRPTPLAELERHAIAQALHWSDGNRARAARALGISLSTLKRRLGEQTGSN